MSFTIHPDPDHIYHPDEGWLKGKRPINEGVIDATDHHVELDFSTGKIGLTRLSPKELAGRKRDAERAATTAKEAMQQLEKRIAILRAQARRDPAFAALVEHLGIPL